MFRQLQTCNLFTIRKNPRRVLWRPEAGLKCEIDAGPDHSEIVSRSADHPKTEIVDPANVAGDPGFKPGAKLAEQFGLAAVVDRECIGDESIKRGHK